jgi:hypothetical protein
MAYFRFYATRSDWLRWVAGLAQMSRFEFVIRKAYRTPHLLVFKNYDDDAICMLNDCAVLMVISHEYSEGLPGLNGPYKDDDGSYWYDVSESVGGPCLMFDVPVNTQTDHGFLINVCTLNYGSWYQDPSSQEWKVIPPELKKAFSDIRRFIQRNSFKRFVLDDTLKADGTLTKVIQQLWIGKEALDLLNAEKAVITAGNYSSGKDLHLSRKTIEIPHTVL